MNNRYFELADDLSSKNRWHLRTVRDSANIELDARDFTYGNFVSPGPPLECSLWNRDERFEAIPPLRVARSRQGKRLDFTYTDEDAPIVTERVADLLSTIAHKDIQRFPVYVDGCDERYDIINVIAHLDCIDVDRSEIEWYDEDEEDLPHLAGKPEMIVKLVVDSSRVGEHHIFRPKDWEVAVIVSEHLRFALEEAQVTGVLFENVSS